MITGEQANEFLKTLDLAMVNKCKITCIMGDRFKVESEKADRVFRYLHEVQAYILGLSDAASTIKPTPQF